MILFVTHLMTIIVRFRQVSFGFVEKGYRYFLIDFKIFTSLLFHTRKSLLQPLNEDSTPTSAMLTSAKRTREASYALATNGVGEISTEQYAIRI